MLCTTDGVWILCKSCAFIAPFLLEVISHIPKKKKKKIFATVLTLILMMLEGPQEAACSFPGAVQGCSGLTVGYWHVEDVLGWQWLTGPQMSGVGG